jgi:hypothetical protein
MLNMLNEITSGDYELVVSYIVFTYTYKEAVTLIASPSGRATGLSESSYIHVHILSISSLVALSLG